MFSLDQLRIFTEPQQGATYDDLLAVAERAEQLGFDAFFRSDHYLAMGAVLDAGGLPGPTDAWTTLAGLARDTSTIRLGTLVTSATFRLPGPLAIIVAGVDQMSGGRVELGLGAGWYEREHEAYAIPFPPLGERFERLEDQLAIITGMWATPTGTPFTYAGKHYTATDSPALPKPVQDGGIPIVIGGGGPKRTPALAARYGAEYNLPFAPIKRFVEQKELVAKACEAIDRDPTSIIYSVGRRPVPRRRRRRGRPTGEGDRPGARRAAQERRGRHARRGPRDAGALAGRGRREDVPPGPRPRRPRAPRRRRRHRRHLLNRSPRSGSGNFRGRARRLAASESWRIRPPGHHEKRSRSSRLRILPLALRGSSSTKNTCFGFL